MKNVLNDILEDAKVSYKESIVIGNKVLEERLLSIIGNAKSLLNQFQENGKSNLLVKEDDKSIESSAIKKVQRRVPLWLMRPHQKNYKILTTYMDLSENDTYPIFLSLLEKNSGLDSKEFISHYNQMKSFAEKAHGRIFEEEAGKVKLWEPVADFIINEFKKRRNSEI